MFEELAGGAFADPSYAQVLSLTGPPKILVRPTSNNDVGIHNMVFQVSLTDAGINYFESFVIEITRCSIHTLDVTPPDPSSYTYYITESEQPLYIPFPTFSYQPKNCPDGTDGLNFSLEPDYSWAQIHD